jgi:hypothetical protein
MKKLIITQSNYIPWKGYFDAINLVDEFIIYDDMQYTRRDWRNRNKIKTPQGSIWLTIPVEVKGKYFQKINETKISDKSWISDHWKSIQHNYSKALFFKELSPFVEELYAKCTFEYLSEVNYHFLKNICDLLGIKTQFKSSSEFVMGEGKTERLVDLCKKVGATDYFSGSAAKFYMDEGLFEKENIKVHYFDYSGYQEYPQLHGEFTHELSILDLLLNVGIEGAKRHMKSFSAAGLLY